jgi:uncharacterized protein YkwD
MPRKIVNKPSAIHRVKRGIKHAVVPHKGNGYHPHLIRRWGIVAVLSIVASLQFIPQSTDQLTVLGEGTDVTSQTLLDDTNAERMKAGVAPLKIDDRLGAAATGKARHMFEQQYWAHTAPDGTTPWYWLREANYRYTYAGENLAKGFRTSSALIRAWMDSAEHRDNMLNPNYEDVGFAVIEGRLNGETTKLVVAMYGTPLRAGGGGVTQTVLAARGSASLMTQIGITLQTMTPTLLASLILLLITAMVSMAAHLYRKYLPKPVLKSWKRHHGFYKAMGMMSLVLLLIALYSDGQII